MPMTVDADFQQVTSSWHASPATTCVWQDLRDPKIWCFRLFREIRFEAGPIHSTGPHELDTDCLPRGEPAG